MPAVGYISVRQSASECVIVYNLCVRVRHTASLFANQMLIQKGTVFKDFFTPLWVDGF